MFPVKNPKGFTDVAEADQARHADAATVVSRHVSDHRPILGDGAERQMREAGEPTHVRTRTRLDDEAEFPTPVILGNEVRHGEQFAVGVDRDRFTVRSLPNRRLTRERPPARAREAIQPGGRAGKSQTSHTLKSPGRCCCCCSRIKR